MPICPTNSKNKTSALESPIHSQASLPYYSRSCQDIHDKKEKASYLKQKKKDKIYSDDH